MIDDPDAPGYRYPTAGERFWHWRQEVWCTVREADGLNYDPRVLGEVPVHLEDGRKAIVKLYNLDETAEA